MSKASVALSQEHKGVLFESINGDILETEAEAISIYSRLLHFNLFSIVNAANQELSHANGLGNNLVAKGGP